MRLDRRVFFDGYRVAFPGKLSVSQVRGLEELLGFAEADSAITDPRWLAYMLATVKHECADTWQPIVERGPRKYFDKYEPDTALGRRLGNVRSGDGYLFRGRGYVQITGRANYARMDDVLELDNGATLREHPEGALRPDLAYRIMSEGMRQGLFTGKRLADYIRPGGCDFVGARRIINGLDRAVLIAGYASALALVIREAVRDIAEASAPVPPAPAGE